MAPLADRLHSPEARFDGPRPPAGLPPRFGLRWSMLGGALPVVMTMLLAPAGCSQELKPIFDDVQPPIAWPPPPRPPRIRYVGQLRCEADLKPPPQPFELLGRIFVGAREPECLFGPRSVVCTGQGQLVWVADPGGRCLHLFDLQKRAYRKVTRAGDSPLLSPVDVCVGPADSIYVCDSEDVAIHRLSATSGEFLETLRLPEDVRRPVAVHYDQDYEELLVVDGAAHDIKVLGPKGRLRRIIGQRGEQPGQFNFPCDVAAEGDAIWIVDAGNSRVQRLNRAGQPIAAFGQSGDAPGDLALPKGVALDSRGHVYVVDARFENLQIFDQSGRLLLYLGQEGHGPGEFWLPSGICIDGHDRIWVCDSYNRRLQVFQYVDQPAVTDSPGPGQAADNQADRPASQLLSPLEEVAP